MKILYVVSTLGRSGPTNQLLNIIRNLDDKEFEPIVLTLSPEPQDSLKFKYDELSIEVKSLGLSRLEGLLYGKAKVKSIIKEIGPTIIHSQGLRADSLLSKICLSVPWLMTSRNYPREDYPMKFGYLKGSLMARTHFSAMKKCKYVVACSKTIATALAEHHINAKAIQNGIQSAISEYDNQNNLPDFESPIFISVGSLIHRKNMSFLIDAFEHYATENKGSLVILGDGPQKKSLIEQSKSGRVYLEGSVGNVHQYLGSADYFISSSLSEGLPNTVLEGLSAGLPALLSDIPSHEEIASEKPECTSIFKLSDGPVSLSRKMSSVKTALPLTYKENAKLLADTVFSAGTMSSNYQRYYKEILFK
ncbi:glycosyltransferase [Vibrio breoganii]|nr:glycosyltransferase [Vibrio breoganii]